MFDLAIFADDVDQDLAHALDVAAELGVNWIEIRSAWGKNLVDHDDETAQEICQTIRARGFRVRCVAAPLLKCKLKGWGQASRELFHTQSLDDLAQQILLLRRAIYLARLSNTTFVRCFSFWRIAEDPTPIWEDLLEAFREPIQVAEQEGITLALENDFECNLGTGELAARFIEQINSPNLRLLWDPGNAYFVGETPYPDGYERTKRLIAHVHVKDAVRDPATGAPRWVALGAGQVDLAGQLRALKADGYMGVVTMENHYTPTSGDKEAGVRESFKGLQRIMGE